MNAIARSGVDRATMGVGLVLFSAMMFSMAGLFVKGADAGAWSIVFWRAVSGSICMILFLMLRGTLRSEAQQMGPAAWLVAFVIAGASSCYLSAFKYTSIANVSLIYAVTPLLAAALAWLVLRERPTLRVVLCSFGALLGVCVIVARSFGTVQLFGDTLALGMAVGSAAILVIYRASPSIPTVLPAVASTVILMPLALMLDNPFAIAPAEIGILLIFGVIFSVGAVAFVEGARRLPSGESALLSTMEVPLAPVLAWAVLGELVSAQVALGGVIVFSAVLLSQLRFRGRRGLV